MRFFHDLVSSFALRFLFLLFFVASLNQSVYGQVPYDEEDPGRIEKEVQGFVQSHRYKIGILRIDPVIEIRGGYDSNALFTETNQTSDYFISAAPGASLGLKLGSKAYFRLMEQFTFLYYHDLEERRNIFNRTRAEFVTGTDVMLISIDGGYSSDSVPAGNEVDVAVDHTTKDIDLHVDRYLSSRFDFHSDVEFRQNEQEAIEEITPDLPPLTGTRSFIVAAGVNYDLKSNLSLTSNLTNGFTRGIESGLESNYWTLIGGVNMQYRKLSGHAGAGYGRSDSEGSGPRSHFVVEGDVNYLLAREFTIGGMAHRNFQPSAFADGALLLQTAVGVRLGFPVWPRRARASADYTIGDNDYGDQLVNGVLVETDRFESAHFIITTRIVGNFNIQTGVQWYKRTSDIPTLTKETTNYLIGFGYSVL